MDSNLIYSYTNDAALADGLKIKLGDALYITATLAHALLDEAAWYGHDLTRAGLQALGSVVDAGILRRYNKGDYGTGDQEFAVYEVLGHTAWAILDGDGLSIILPEDY